MSFSFDALKTDFFRYLKNNGSVGNKRAEDLLKAKTSIFAYSSEFKKYLEQNGNSLNLPQNFSGNISDILALEFNDNKFSTNAKSENISFMSSLLNEMFNKNDIKKAADSDGNGTISKEEMNAFLEGIKQYDNNQNDISLDDLLKADEEIKNGKFSLKKAENTPTETPTAEENAGNVSGNPYSDVPAPTNDDSSDKNNEEKSLKNMSLDELNTEKTNSEKDKKELSDKYNAIMDGTDSAIKELKETADKSFDDYKQTLQALDSELAGKLQAAKQSVDTTKASIDTNEKNITQQEDIRDTNDAEANNAQSEINSLNSSKSALEAQLSSADKNTDTTNIKAQISEIEGKIKEAEERKKAAEDKRDAAKTTLETLNSEKTTLTTQLQEQQSQLDKVQQEADKLTMNGANPELKQAKETYEAAQKTYETEKTKAASEAKTNLIEKTKYINDIDSQIQVKKNEETEKSYSKFNSYDEDTGKWLANIASKHIRGTYGFCMGGVSDILGKAYGQKLDRLSAAYKGIGAFLGTSKYAQYYEDLADCFTYHGSPITRDELKDLPAGCVVFGDRINGGTGDGALYGHAFITVGDGQHAICDHYETLTRMDTKYYVFYPNGKKLKKT